MNKCEWEDGKFEGCTVMKYRISECGWSYENSNINNGMICKAHTGGIYIMQYCPQCGADIRKPEEKPLIVKDGETWAAHWKGVDYLLTMGTKKETPPSLFYTLKNTSEVARAWKPFSEIEKEGLTDEIAKLRPIMTGWDNRSLCILWGIKDNLCGIVERYGGTWIGTEPIENLKLATPYELQESE